MNPNSAPVHKNDRVTRSKRKSLHPGIATELPPEGRPPFPLEENSLKQVEEAVTAPSTEDSRRGKPKKEESLVCSVPLSTKIRSSTPGRTAPKATEDSLGGKPKKEEPLVCSVPVSKIRSFTSRTAPKVTEADGTKSKQDKEMSESISKTETIDDGVVSICFMRDVTCSAKVDTTKARGRGRPRGTKKILNKQNQSALSPPLTRNRKRKRDEPGEYTVDYIMDKRESVYGGEIDYLVKWQGYSQKEATWEPQEHVVGCTVVDKFEEELKIYRMKGLVKQNGDVVDIPQSEAQHDVKSDEDDRQTVVDTDEIPAYTNERAFTILYKSAKFVKNLLLWLILLVGCASLAAVVLSNYHL